MGEGGDDLWYKDAIIYEVHARAFCDSDGDGKGDFRGLMEKLDYIQDLGVTAIWLLPFYPSPWRDDGYDTSHYMDVHPAYGTMRDFQNFLREAHRRGLRVITELILNHTSDQHPWFQRSRQAKPGSRWREFYVWSDTPDKYKEARIIFKDFQTSNWTWDPLANAYYWHRFYSHQPDLNYDSPLVRRAMFRVVDFWLDQGVDGFRLDAIPYLYEREGTSCDHLPETHAFLKDLRAHIDSKYGNRVLLAEANQWPEDAASYLSPDECHMSFHFPLMPRLFAANRMEDRFPIVEILRQTPEIAPTSQWALFLRNHDELTLEMVTSEERDYMYRVYAQDPQTRINLGIRRRLAPLLGNDRRRVELMNALLFSLPGTPVVYYGDEIGMGDNVYLGDRNGVRTPMQWSPDRNAGFSHTNPHRLYLPVNIDPEYHYEAVNVEAQQQNTHSLLRWMKRLVSVRKQFRSFGRGTMLFLHPENHRVLAFCRQYGKELVLVVANLSRFVQSVRLNLSEWKGLTPVEMLGGSELPEIGEELFSITLGPYTFYWLSIEDRRSSIEALPRPQDGAAPQTAQLEVRSWANVFDDRTRAKLANLLPNFLKTRRWFRGQARVIDRVEFLDILPIRPTSSYIILTQVHYTSEDPEIYSMLASVAIADEAERAQTEFPDAVAARLLGADGKVGILYSALWDQNFSKFLLEAIFRRRRIRGETGELVALPSRSLRDVEDGKTADLQPVIYKAEQTNSSILFGNRFMLKLFRCVEAGTHPDLEISRYLTERKSFLQIAPVAGHLEYRSSSGEPMVLGVLHGFVQHETDAWHYTLDALSRFFERTQNRREWEEMLYAAGERHPLALSRKEIPAEVSEMMGSYFERARLLGQRTAEMHVALDGTGYDPDFTAQPFSESYRQELYHGVVALTQRTVQRLRRQLNTLPAHLQDVTRRVLDLQPQILAHMRLFRAMRMTGSRIRMHGNYHLGEVLYTGMDFVIIDFEGEPQRHLSERRIERSPLWDVVCMLGSFHNAAHVALLGQVPGVSVRSEDSASFLRWADFWYRWASASFLKGYLPKIEPSGLLPPTDEQIGALMTTLALERAMNQALRESERPSDRLIVPLTDLVTVIEAAPIQSPPA